MPEKTRFQLRREAEAASGTAAGHAPDYIEEPGNIDRYRCSCGWESRPYADGQNYAFNDWVGHVKQQGIKIAYPAEAA